MTTAALDRNEIWTRAHAFKERFRKAKDETAESQTFWLEFFLVFGQDFRELGTFEGKVKHQKGTKKTTREMDVFWPGIFLCEQKSRGKNLDEAMKQAQGYVNDLIRENRHTDVPRYMAVCDFERMVLWDRENDSTIEFLIAELENYIDYFGFIAGYDVLPADPEAEVNIQAAVSMGELRKALVADGYPEEDLARFMTRVLFILFAEDTGICGGEPSVFQRYLEKYTKSNGEGVGEAIQKFFETFDRPKNKRSKRLPEELQGLEHVNGSLFAENVGMADFTAEMRTKLLACCQVNWEQIRPEIFGVLFQDAMDDTEQRQIGAHYTTRPNIRKVIDSLFLDELKAELDKLSVDRSTQKNKRLDVFLDKLAGLNFFDPACGSGNFLLLTYREIRRLETRALQERHQSEGVGVRMAQQLGVFAVADLNRVKVDQFHGIEVKPFSAEIARVALWLMDHLSNREMSQKLGQYFARFPLTESANIHTGNALRMDWSEIVTPGPHVYVLGNPPFVGKHLQDASQKSDVATVWKGEKRAKTLDYVTCWFKKAAELVAGTGSRVAFVSTNSICLGEQPAPLWNEIFRLGLSIDFAHQTFAWQSDIRGGANVHCIIVGFSDTNDRTCVTFRYKDLKGAPEALEVQRISPYLVEGPPIALASRMKPLNGPALQYASKPADGGHLILTDDERTEILAEDPGLDRYIRVLNGAESIIHGNPRWCLWFPGAPATVLKKSKLARSRVDACRRFRLDSKKAQTQTAADRPMEFAEVRYSGKPYLAIPRHSSELRRYVPFAWLEADVICTDAVTTLPDASIFDFGIMTSLMHNAWTKRVAGRIKSDIRYSGLIVYNNYPWPKPTDAQRSKIEALAQAILDARAAHADSTLADLYDPLTMPANLLKAHKALDRAVDKAYRKEAFDDDDARVKHLFELYEELTAETA